VGLKPGDYVQITPQPDMSLLVVPGDKKGEESPEAFVDAVSASSPEEVTREFIACYLTGYDVIRLRFGKRMDEYKAHIKNVMRNKLIGLETVKESTDHMVVRCLLGHVDFPVKDALNRMHAMALSMCKDAVRALENRDASLANDIVQRDDEVDRLYLFVVRELKLAIENRMLMKEMGLESGRECLGYRLIIKSIERVADHAARIARIIPSLNISDYSDLLKLISNMAEVSYSIYQDSVKSLHKLDIKRANESIMKVQKIVRLEEELIKRCLRAKLDAKTLIGLRLILESLRRIAEYGADIAEIVINLAVKPRRR